MFDISLKEMKLSELQYNKAAIKFNGVKKKP
jgi:hypothetical protein